MSIDRSSGFVPVWRHVVSEHWEWAKDFKTTFLYIWLTAKANWVAKEWKGRLVLAGQYITSLNRLSEETGMTIQHIRTALKHLESTHYITHEATRNFSIITINNYDELYSINTRTNTPITNDQHTDSKQLTTTKPLKPLEPLEALNHSSKVDKPPSQTRFIPPTVDEVAAYVKERNSHVDPETFVDFYTSKGWLVGKNKMKDWRAACRRWETGGTGNRDRDTIKTVEDYDSGDSFV